MKKVLATLLAVMFLAVVAGSAFAAEPTPSKTPAAKTMKHKRTHKKKMSKTVKPSTTPMVKK